MNESDTRLKLIDPALKKAWELDQIRTEYRFTDGEIVVRGRMTSRKKPKKADYLLLYAPEPDVPIAIAEAKDTDHSVGTGLQQAMGYAQALDVPFAYSSNGKGFILYRLKRGGRAAAIIPDGFLFGQDSAKVEIKRRLVEEFNLHTVVRMPQSVFAPYTSITTNILFFDNIGRGDGVWFYRMDMPEGYKHFSKTKPMRREHFGHVREWWNDRKEIELPNGPKAKHYSIEELVNGGFNFDLCGYPHEEEVILPPDELIRNYRAERARLDAEIDEKLAQICEILGIED